MTHKKARVPKAYIQNKIAKGISRGLQQNAAYKLGYEQGSSDVKGVCTIQFSEKINQLRLEKENLNNHIDALNADLTNAERQIQSLQAENHALTEQQFTKTHVVQSQSSLVNHYADMSNDQFLAALSAKPSLLVDNWRDSWKWISTWCFALIAFFAAVDIPPELLAVLPENVREAVILFTVFCGFVGRYINQSGTGARLWQSKS